MKDLAQKILKQVKAKKAVEAEVYISRNRGLSIEVEKDNIKTFEQSEDWGIGLRVIDGRKVGFSSCSGTGDDLISGIIENAIQSSAFAGEDKARLLPEKQEKGYPEYNLSPSDISSVSVEEKIGAARLLERSGMEYDKRITKSNKSAYWDSEFEVAVANTLGIDYFQSGTACGCSITLVAEDSKTMETGWEMDRARKFSALDFEKVGRTAAEKSVRMLGAKSVATGSYPAVLDNYVAMEFLGLLSSSLCADNVQKGKSMFAGKKGISVAPASINLIDCGFHPDAVSVFPADSEGVPVAEKKLISGGLLQGFLYDTYTACKDGVKSTGNGFRGSYKSTPSVGTGILYVRSEKVDSMKDIIASVDKGILVTEAMGVHTANPVTGDFSFGIEGLLIESGKLSHPVRGVMISGNVIDMIRNIEMVEDRIRFFGRIGSQSLKISLLSISGH
ncbi:MAG: TldD/PmbA family protein [Candidatus Schekmanbacteria bacterium]|nr:TldD/PmbA family protein [Candidatus Schekmanbacteria bacterium]